jgi:hypothetical protein
MKRASRSALGLVALSAATGAGVWLGLRDAQSPLYPGLVMPFLTSRFLDPEDSHRLAVQSAALGLTPVDEVQPPRQTKSFTNEFKSKKKLIL